MHKFLVLTFIAVAVAVSAVSADSEDAHAEIVRLVNDIQKDGKYSYNYETSNGITVQEEGIAGQAVKGGFAYQSPEHELIQVSYTADASGFQPIGSHLPTPPPIPVAILKSLEYSRTHHYQPEY
ncbi:pupal cuticle protein-like [Musca vetustissima]|uniref:pupal cuticle protein-like n=1 Tax=Musca vetustissima TaxID=27455 RepID=UPI002AB60991|nr:pupal cuticle protein-like [Musca vetustissima]